MFCHEGANYTEYEANDDRADTDLEKVANDDEGCFVAQAVELRSILRHLLHSFIKYNNHNIIVQTFTEYN